MISPLPTGSPGSREPIIATFPGGIFSGLRIMLETLNKHGRTLSANKLREKQLRPLLEKQGIPRGCCHSMHHGAAVRCVLMAVPGSCAKADATQ